MTKEKQALVDEIYKTLEQGFVSDDTYMADLERAMAFFCSSHDIVEGYKYAITQTLDEQSQHHSEDLELADLKRLLDILKGAI